MYQTHEYGLYMNGVCLIMIREFVFFAQNHGDNNADELNELNFS